MLGSNLSLGTSRLISSSKSEAAPSNKILGNNPPPSSSQAPYPSFCLEGKSSLIPLLLLSPANPLTLGFPGAPIAAPEQPRETVRTAARHKGPFV